jgi:hypothetical protein
MATQLLNRRALRHQHDVTDADRPEEVVDADEADEGEDAPKPRVGKKATKSKMQAKPKTPAKPRVRKKAVKAPDRTFARWAVFDNGAKRVAVFEYSDRAGADAKLAEVRERKPGTYYLALVKDPYDPPAASATPVASPC